MRKDLWALGDKITILFGYLFYMLKDIYEHANEVFDEFVQLNPDDRTEVIKRIVNKFPLIVIHSHNAPNFYDINYRSS